MKLLKKVATGVGLSVLALTLMTSAALAQSNTEVQQTTQAKHTVVDSNGKVFTYVNKSDADQHIQAIITKHKDAVKPLEGNYHATFWEHGYYHGSYFDFGNGNQSGYVGNAWNDRISSIKAPYLGNGLQVFEHNNFSGASLYIAPGGAADYLGNYSLRTGTSWNDQISSIKVY
ncbi:hypothetical protein [Paenibacillus agilis]|uniref:DUF4879 domain-containing protein n=1 Tax=Paenibacillus agilis TaxID=3020863 RepID=A0A559IQA7_9BACL|nr:hypothetical protein [Paenibacillus agilis]TVX89806.1 hypothetical protein FPZ44_18840 [Paenibacillus agilis]